MTMKTRILIAALSSLLLFNYACTEKIDIDLDETYTRLVVEGSISTETKAHEVHLSTTTNYYYNQQPPAVSGATVTITDGTTIFPLTEDSTRPGYYLTQPDVKGIPGKTYTLNIVLAQPINEKTTYSATSRMEEVGVLDSIEIRYLDRWEVFEVGCYAWDPPITNFYMFNIYKNGILMTDSINEVIITDDRFFNGNYTNGVGVGYLSENDPTENVRTGDTIMMEIAGITEEYYKFVMAVQIETGYKNPLFSGPPANIKGNISNGAIGYFATCSVNYATTVAP